MYIRDGRLIVLVAFLCGLIAATWVPPGNSLVEKYAEFTQVIYSSKVRTQTTDTWKFTVHNVNCSENDDGSARFFLEFYLAGGLWFDEYNSTRYKTWVCNRGESVSHSYEIRGWSATRPVNQDLRIDLYWFSNGTAHHVDTASFTVAVTVLVPLQHVFATGYLAVYLIACFLLLAYDYVASLEE